ncbi:Asp23/Gls24 family envelope stress response protein [Pseudonocardia sp. HH130630-07]|uniref:Asp23/Gls24 family envelope stress response protein n=1 Tax=Pseudonocardia sp. HH130630-07 TaxID=1690815 RepID=UPI000814E53E|nr:Asp23/Gls24 family envelope stress response protein [Pseudonocardia sp. HH130630-07]ANY05491.1 hypothetical protein AFB00_03300 [Pseudonocardia sp. HH130630-07]
MSTVRLRVSDLAAARVAARRARAVPGVVALLGDLQQTLLGLATDRLPRRPVPAELRAHGVVAVVHEREIEVRVTVRARFGTPLADLADRVRREVAEELAAVTGRPARVLVTVADIELPS